MENAICIVSISPVRVDSSDKSEMITQLLFGEQLTIIDKQKQWLKIKIDFDGYEGWVDHKQVQIIEKKDKSNQVFVAEMVDLLLPLDNYPLALPMGSELPFYEDNKVFVGEKVFTFQGKIVSNKQDKQQIVNLALKYINAPYLWGGKTPFGIDCSGLTQMAYKLCGFNMPRDAYQQAELGEALNFIEEAESGDLAFFENELGKIMHVGILLEDKKILHAHGKVRIDPIDQFGIFNTDLKKYSHKLRVIKRIV